LADAAGALVVVVDPGGFPERGLVADVLAVQARELCDPSAVIVAAKAGHRAVHASSRMPREAVVAWRSRRVFFLWRMWQMRRRNPGQTAFWGC
jgi:hypothetical protein